MNLWAEAFRAWRDAMPSGHDRPSGANGPVIGEGLARLRGPALVWGAVLVAAMVFAWWSGLLLAPGATLAGEPPSTLDLLAQAVQQALREVVQLIQGWQSSEPALAWACFCGVFAVLSALSLPGCSVLAVAAGALWGPWWGSIWVTLASALGAMLPFYLARAWGRHRLESRFPRQLQQLDRGMARAGLRYLLLLRLVPVVPYTVVNPLMGLTPMRAGPFFAVSALGMWAGSAVYALAGAGLSLWAFAGA